MFNVGDFMRQMFANNVPIPNKQMMFQQLLQSNPAAARAWNASQQMVRGKNNDEKLAILKNIAKEKGVSYEDLKQSVKNFNINLP